MSNNLGLNYGQFVNELEKLSPETIIRFDFGYFTPKGYYSYRGYYEDCAIGYTDDIYDNLTAETYLHLLKSYKGETLYGYKGGEWAIHDNTSLWVAADSSQCTGTIITGITDLGYGYAIINTTYED